jgi:hypothetical protein
LCYTLRKLEYGDVFGHEEILQQLRRRCRVRALNYSSLIYLNEKDFIRLYPESEIQLLKQNMIELNIESITAKIKKYEAEIK